MLRKKIYFLAYIFIVIRSEKCRCSLLDPPPEITCSLLCKDDFINDLEQLLSDSTNGMDFEKLVYNWKNLFDRASIERQKYICWHYVDFDHCLRHCVSDPKIFIPVQLEPLEVHCVSHMADYATSVECIGQYHHAIESNCAAYKNSIKLALERWTQNENFCKLISQHLDCLTINAEFYCGSQLVDRTFFAKRYHTIISVGNEITTIKKLLSQCYTFSISNDTLSEIDKKFSGVFVTTSTSETLWSIDTTEATTPNLTATIKLGSRPTVFTSHESNLPQKDYFAKSMVIFSPVDNLSILNPDQKHQEPMIKAETPQHQPLLPAHSSGVSHSWHYFNITFICLYLIGLLCLRI